MRNRKSWISYSSRIGRKSLSISFLIHFAGISLLVTSPWKRNDASKYEVFNVQIIDLSKIEVPRTEIPLQEREPEATPAPEKVVQIEKRSGRKNETKIQSEPPRQLPSFSAEKFRESIIARTEKNSQPPVEKKSTNNVPVKIAKIESSLIEISVSNISMTIPQWYISQLHNRIKENWRTNTLLGIRTSVVSFRINRNGRIENISLEKSSGNPSFDKLAVDAVKTTTQIPPFPTEIPNAYLDIMIDFKTEG